MQFLKSLLCLHGFDNRTRFFAICSAVYVVFIMIASAFTGIYFISIIILALFTTVLAFAHLRRLKDSQLKKKWLLAPNIIFALVSLIIIFSEQYGSYLLLVIPALCSAVLLTYPSANQRDFVLGYFGPVDMGEYKQETHQGKLAKFRIEPTLVSDNSMNFNSNEQTGLHTSEVNLNKDYLGNSTPNKQTDIGEMIRLKLIANKNAQRVIAIVIGIIILVVLASWLMNSINASNATILPNDVTQQAKSALPVVTREYPLVMPDNYTLYLSTHKGITLNWQADEVNETIIWSQLTTLGDESCQQISFNKGEPIRTLSVQVEGSEYYASFSPLDSKALIQALAFRGNFTLCGYDFSLKGSQAVLGKNKQYARWVDY